MAYLLIHIGAHKTGTTTLQSTFDRNRRALSAEGAGYPRTNWYHFAQHRLAFAMRGKRDPVRGDVPALGRELDDLNAALARSAPGERVLVSSEEFFAASEEQISRLRDGLVCDEVGVLAVVRRPDEMLLSSYNQNTKAPENTFSKRLQVCLDDPAGLSADMDQPACVSRWARVFGHDTVHLRAYETIEIIPEVCRLLDVSPDVMPLGQNTNSSAPAAVIEVMRVSKVAGMAPEARRKLYKQAQKVFAGYPRIGLSGADRQRILAMYEQAFETLFAEFGLTNAYRADLVDASEPAPKPQAPAQLYAKLVESLL